MSLQGAPQMPPGAEPAIGVNSGVADTLGFTSAPPMIPEASGYADPFEGVPVKDSSASSPVGITIPEMNALREWEDKHERELEEKARKEETEKKDRREEASDELGKYYEERAANLKKRQTT